MNMKHVTTVIVFMLLSQIVYAQSVETVKGEYTYMVPEYESREIARLKAIDLAKIEALREEFGTIVSQSNILLMEESNTQSNNSFYSLGTCDVNGIWLKDTEEPTITEEFKDGQHWMIAKVKGKGRELKTAQINIDCHLLRNGKGDEFESDDFYDGNRFYISFRSPAKGYLAIYLLDPDRNAFPIVPSQDSELFPVKRGERYVFVDNEEEHLILTTDRPLEINQIYIIFSPNKFYPNNVIASNGDTKLERYRTEDFNSIYRPPYVPYEKFVNWLGNLRVKDNEMQVVTKLITIKGTRVE